MNHRPGRGEALIDEVPERVRDAAHKAFAQREAGLPVLDLALDTILDVPEGAVAPTRRLRFAGHGCAVTVHVTGRTSLSLDVDVDVESVGQAEVELRQVASTGDVEVRRCGGDQLTDVPPGLTSLRVSWPGTDRKAVRTAWVRL